MQGNAKLRLSAHFTLHSSHFTLHTSHLHFTLHLTSKHVSSSHLISARLISSHLFSHVIKVSQLFSSHPSTDQPFYLLEVVLNSSQLFCTPESSYCQTDVSCTKKTLGAESFCTQTLEAQMHLDRKAFPKYFVQSLHKVFPSTTLYYQSLHKALPSTTLYYKACTKHFPVPLCTTKAFVLQDLHKARPSTTLYYLHKVLPSTTLCYKACTKHFPVVLCTTKLAQSTSQYYFVLQSLHKTLPSNTL